MIEVDIILPYYNGSKFISEQLNSIFRSNLEGISLRVILVNDASTEAETKFIKTLLNPRILYIENQVNLGVIKSVEKGLKLSSAPYLLLCDQDDVWLDQKIIKTVEALKSVNVETPKLVYTDLTITGPNLELMNPSMHSFFKHDHTRVFPSILLHNIITGCTIGFNRKLLEIALPFPCQVTMHDHWLAVCATFSGQVKFLNESTILYRQHGGNQIGAPTTYTISKILDFRRSIPKFKKHILLKIEMARQLSKRLRQVGLVKESHSLNEVINAFHECDIIYLLNKGVLSGSIERKVSVATLLVLLKNQIQMCTKNLESH